MLHNENKPIVLVDLDTVEPAYTLRPLKKELENLGLKVIAQTDYTGLGEAGNVITLYQKNCLLNAENIVIDVGYGVGGLDVLDVINNIEEEPNLLIYIVINTSKPENSSPEEIVEYIKWSLGRGGQKWKNFSGIISNTHFAEETTLDDIIRGYNITKQAAKELNLPVRAIAATEALAPLVKNIVGDETEVWALKRFMPKALW